MTCPAFVNLDGVCNCVAARRAARYLTAAYDKALVSAELRITQFAILHKLAQLGPMTIKRLAADIAMDRTTLAINLKPLKRNGLLVIAVAEDKRARVVLLTKQGRAKLKEALPLWIRAQARFENGYGAVAASELRSVLEGFYRLDSALGPYSGEAWPLILAIPCALRLAGVFVLATAPLNTMRLQRGAGLRLSVFREAAATHAR